METFLDWAPIITSFIGTFGGIIISNKLTLYRIQQLENKVEKHNSVVERMFIAEGDIKTVNAEIENIYSDIDDLRKRQAK